MVEAAGRVSRWARDQESHSGGHGCRPVERDHAAVQRLVLRKVAEAGAARVLSMVHDGRSVDRLSR